MALGQVLAGDSATYVFLNTRVESSPFSSYEQLGTAGGSGLAAGDVNADDRTDLVVWHASSRKVRAYLGQQGDPGRGASWLSATPVTTDSPVASPRSGWLDDVDGDHIPDLILKGDDPAPWILFGDGTGAFPRQAALPN